MPSPPSTLSFNRYQKEFISVNVEDEIVTLSDSDDRTKAQDQTAFMDKYISK